MTELEEIIGLGFETQIAEVYTALPCRIVQVVDNLEDLRVDVQPLIDTKYSDGTSEEHSLILGVPVIFPQGRMSMLSFPLFVDDTVLCVFSQRGLDNFKSGSGQPAPAADMRMMDSRDAVAIPGLVPFAKSLNKPVNRRWPHSTRDMVLAHNIMSGTECEVRLKQNGDVQITTNQNVIVNCQSANVNAKTSASIDTPQLSINAANTTWTGNVAHTGTFTFNGIPFATHKHTGVTPGMGVSATPVA